MKGFKTTIAILYLVFFNVSCAQELSQIDLKSRQTADSIVSTHFSEKIKNNDYVIFSIADRDFLIVINKKDKVEEYYLRKDDGKKDLQIKSTVYNKPNSIFDKMFNKKLYRKEFTTFTSDFFKPEYELAKGNSTYFVLNSGGQRLGEARLTVFVQPNPIDVEVYNHLVHKTIHYLNN